jgi:teichuronic acid biosynthesis glycosyltransferase TuaG
MILVSVVIPYFKKKKFFKKTLQSVVKQTYKNLEIIIIYDDLDQEELFFIKELISFDSRIKLLINKKNLGAGISRNKGIKFSKGEFIAFIDADDIWKPNKIEKQLQFMIKNKLSITHTNYRIVDKNGKNKNIRYAKNFDNINSLLKSCDIGLSTVMIKKSLLLKNKFQKIKTKEDFVLWLQIIKSSKIIGLNYTLSSWRKSKRSLSSSIVQKLCDGFIVYNKYMKFNYMKSLIYLFILSFNFLLKNLFHGSK